MDAQNAGWSPKDLDRFAKRLAKIQGKPRSQAPSKQSKIDPEVQERVAAFSKGVAEAKPEDLDTLLGLSKLLEQARTRLAPSEVSHILRHIVAAFSGARSEPLKQAIRDRVLSFFEDGVKMLLRGERLDKVEPFIDKVVTSLTGTDLIAGHPLARKIREVRENLQSAHEMAENADAEVVSAEERLIRKLIGRRDVAASLAAVRAFGLEGESRNSKFVARFENRLLGINLDVLDRFEEAVRVSDRLTSFDKRFQVLDSIFPEGTSEDEDPLGKFAWVLGLDIKTQAGEGYDGALFGLEDLDFATPALREAFASPGGDFPSFDMGRLKLGKLPKSSKLSAPKPVTKIGGGSGSVKALFSGKMLELPREAVSALRLGDFSSFAASVNKAFPGDAARAIVRNVRGKLKVKSPVSVGGIGHLKAGFEGLQQNRRRREGLSQLGRLTGGLGGGRLGYVGASSSSFVGTPRSSMGPRRPSLSAPAARPTSLRSGSSAGFASSVADAPLRLRGPQLGSAGTLTSAFQVASHSGLSGLRGAMAAPSMRSSRMPSMSAPRSETSAFAIASDSFGVPRFRGSRPVSTPAMRAAGVDLSGTAVLGSLPRMSARSGLAGSVSSLPRSSASTSLPALPGLRLQSGSARTAGVRRAPGSLSLPKVVGGSSLHSSMRPQGGFTRDDHGIVRLGTGRSSASSLAPVDLRVVDLAGRTGGSNFRIPTMAGMATAPRASFGAGALPSSFGSVDRMVAPALSLTHTRGGGRASAPGGRRFQAAQATTTSAPGALGPVDLSFPSVNLPSATLSGPALRPVSGRRSGGFAVRSGGGAGAERSSFRLTGSELTGRSVSTGSFLPSLADLTSAAPLGRPRTFDKYYGAVESQKLAVGRMQSLELRGFSGLGGGGASSAGQSASTTARGAGSLVSASHVSPSRSLAPTVASGGQARRIAISSSRSQVQTTALTSRGAGLASDFSSASLVRLTGGETPAQALQGRASSFDAGGFTSSRQLGQLSQRMTSTQEAGGPRAERIRRDISQVQVNFSGARMKGFAASTLTAPLAGTTVGTSQSLLGGGGADRGAQALVGGAGTSTAGQSLAAARGGHGSAQQQLSGRGGAASSSQRGSGARGGQAAVSRGAGFGGAQRLAAGAGAQSRGQQLGSGRAQTLPAQRPGRVAPRLEGVYGLPAQAARPQGNDVLGLARSGYEARFAPSRMNARYQLLGIDADLGSRLAPRASGAGRRGGASAATATATASQQLVSSHGRAASGAASGLDAGLFGSAPQAIMAARGQVQRQVSGLGALAQDLVKLGRTGARATAQVEAMAQATSPAGQVAQRTSGSRRTTQSGRARSDNRFRLDGWSAGGPVALKAMDSRAPATQFVALEGGPMAGGDGQRLTRSRGRLSEAPRHEGLAPLDLLSQLVGRTGVVAGQARERSERGVAFGARNFGLPAHDAVWADAPAGQFLALGGSAAFGRSGQRGGAAGGQQKQAQRGAASRSGQLRGTAPRSGQRSTVRRRGGALGQQLGRAGTAQRGRQGTLAQSFGGLGVDLGSSASRGAAGHGRLLSTRGLQRAAEQASGSTDRARSVIDKHLQVVREARRLSEQGGKLPIGSSWTLTVAAPPQATGATAQSPSGAARAEAEPTAGPAAQVAPKRRPDVRGQLLKLADQLQGREGRAATGTGGAVQRLSGQRRFTGGQRQTFRPGKARQAPRQALLQRERQVSEPAYYDMGDRGESRPMTREMARRAEIRERPHQVAAAEVDAFEPAGVQRKAATHWVADTEMQKGPSRGTRLARPERARMPATPAPDLTQLVYQIYNRLKSVWRDETFRRTGGF